jgi:hypothetical protein
MDPGTVINELYAILEKGGGIVIVGGGGDSVQKSKRVIQKDLVVKRLISKYLGSKRRAGSKFYEHPRLDFEKDLFSKPPFKNFEKHQYNIQMSKNIDQILGHLHSMSWATARLFGDKISDFDNELRHELQATIGPKPIIEKYRIEAHFLTKK